MPEEMQAGCAKPLSDSSDDGIQKDEETQESSKKEVKTRMIQVGQKAPDFIAPALYQDKFVQVKLSEYLGKWVVLCFYPGDFTFV